MVCVWRLLGAGGGSYTFVTYLGGRKKSGETGGGGGRKKLGDSNENIPYPHPHSHPTW